MASVADIVLCIIMYAASIYLPTMCSITLADAARQQAYAVLFLGRAQHDTVKAYDETSEQCVCPLQVQLMH